MVQAGPTHCRRHPAVEKSSSCDLDGHSPPLLARKAPAPLLCCPLARVAVTPPYCRACTPVRRPTRAVARLQWALRLALPALQSCSIAPPLQAPIPRWRSGGLRKRPSCRRRGSGQPNRPPPPSISPPPPRRRHSRRQRRPPRTNSSQRRQDILGASQPASCWRICWA